MEPKDQKTILLIAILAIVGIALGLAFKGGDDTPNTPVEPEDPEPDIPSYSGDVLINYGEGVEQGVIDIGMTHQNVADLQHIFYVVPFTILNDTGNSHTLSPYDVLMHVEGGLNYNPYISAKLTTGSIKLDPGEMYKGSWVFEIPANHGPVSIECEDTKIDSTLNVDPAPERELGQVLGKVEYGAEFTRTIVSKSGLSYNPSGSNKFLVLDVILTNISYSNDITLNTNYVVLIVDGQDQECADITHIYPGNETLPKAAFGYSCEKTLIYEVPSNYSESDIVLKWDNSLQRGIQFIAK